MKREKTSGEHYKFESLVSVSLLLVFIMVVVTGVLSYVRLDNIIYTVSSGIRPDARLILVKEIYSHLLQAENKVKSYTLTRNKEDMTHFYEFVEMTGEKMDELKELVRGDEVINPYIDTLDILVEKKYDILDMLLVIQDEFLVKKAMDEVMQNITIQSPDPVVTTEEPDTTTVVKEPLRKENVFKRLFKKKNKKIDNDEVQPEVQTDSQLVLQAEEGDGKIIPDSLNQMDPDDGVVTVDDINEQVKKVQTKALAEEKSRRNKELELFSQDNLVMQQIRKLLNELEALEAKNLQENTQLAENDASEVKLIIRSFGLATLLLLILAGAVIYLYIRRNNEYRAILRSAKNDAEELAQAKERFLANMSHEIRTPMNIISGYLSQILQTPLSPKQKDHVEIVKKSADHLLQLLNNLLDLSKLQADKLELIESDFSPAELIMDVRKLFSQAAAEKNLQFMVEISPAVPAVVSGDPVRLRQILFNLAANAVKFTGNGKVTIKVYPGKAAGEMTGIVFEVSDTGIGIPKAESARIFEEFEQGTSSISQRSEGSGLGLAITAKLVSLLGGTIELQSSQGKGSTFRVEIPYLPGKGIPQPVPPADLTDTELLNGLKVLVVDDENYNRGLVKLILGKYNCTLFEASNGPEAIDLVREQDIGMILMDIRMPGMSGPETVQEIIKIMANRPVTTPVIALSAGISREDRMKYRRNGFDDILSKPFEEDELLKVIISLIKRDPGPLPVITEPGSSGLPQYDLTPLRESCEGNEAFFLEMVQMFLKSTGAGLDEMDELLKKKDWANVAELAHKISAPCRHLKAEKLYSLLKLIEQQMAEGTSNIKAAESLLLARKEFDQIRKGILEQLEFKSI